jgi:IclR family pca regulon transcriptional regulator
VTASEAVAGAGRPPIASLLKSLRVLERLALAGGSSSVGALIDDTGLERTTVQRILRTLHAERYLERTARGEYAVAPRAYLLGMRLADSSHLTAAVEPALRDLQRRTGETVHAGVLDGTDVLSVACIPAERILTFDFPAGARIPAYASSLGRVLLASLPRERALEVLRLGDRRARTPHTLTAIRDLTHELDRVREQGFSETRNEVEIGVASVAAPVLGPSGVALAAVNVVVPTAKLDGADGYDDLVREVRTAARELSLRLDHRCEDQ